MEAFSAILFGIGVIILILLVIGILYFLAKLMKGEEKKRPGHLDLYFDSNFGTIIAEWDLMSRSKVKDWKKGMASKLSAVGKDIDRIGKKRTDIDGRLAALERDVAALEKQ